MVLLLFLPVILAFLGGITAFFIRQNKPRHLVVSIAVFSAAATALLLMFRRPEDIALLQLGGTLALGISRAYYTDGHETDVEATFSFPVSSWLSLQPAVHFITTDGRRSTVAMLRVSLTPFS